MLLHYGLLYIKYKVNFNHYTYAIYLPKNTTYWPIITNTLIIVNYAHDIHIHNKL